jgi:nucleoid DNA-binding protein
LRRNLLSRPPVRNILPLLASSRMKKAELAARLAREAGVSQAEAADQLQHLVSRIISNLKKGETARLPGLGKFTPGPRWSFQFEPKERKPAPRRGKR